MREIKDLQRKIGRKVDESPGAKKAIGALALAALLSALILKLFLQLALT